MPAETYNIKSKKYFGIQYWAHYRVLPLPFCEAFPQLSQAYYGTKINKDFSVFVSLSLSECYGAVCSSNLPDPHCVHFFLNNEGIIILKKLQQWSLPSHNPLVSSSLLIRLCWWHEAALRITTSFLTFISSLMEE